MDHKLSKVDTLQRFLLPAVTIGFEEPQYSATEGTDPSVEVCALVLDGMLERDAIITFFTRDGTATSFG